MGFGVKTRPFTSSELRDWGGFRVRVLGFRVDSCVS